MKRTEILNPAVLAMPFALNGDKNTIPATNDPLLGDASQNNGFPPITAVDINDGGIPPSRQDFNGLGYLTSSHNFFAQNGNFYSFDNEVASSIQGYPQGAKLWYTDSDNNVRLLVSLKDDNMDNFITNPAVIGVSWEDCIPTLEEIKQTTLQYNRTSGSITQYVQNINYEQAADGTFTLKAGSTVYVPNGPGVYTAVTLQNDISRKAFGSGSSTIFLAIYNSLNTPGLSFWADNADSGNSTTPGTNTVYYNEDLNSISFYNTSGIIDSEDWSLPFLQVTVENGIIKSVDNILDYQSFIGHWHFAFPGLTGLIPNGIKTDGTLNNILATTTGVVRRKYTWSITNGQRTFIYPQSNTLGSSSSIIHYYEQETAPELVKNTYWLDTKNNVMYYSGNAAESWDQTICFYIGDVYGDNTGKISRLEPRPALRLVDTSILERIYFPQLKNIIANSNTINYAAAVAQSLSTEYTSSGGCIYGNFHVDYYSDRRSELYINGTLITAGYSSATLGLDTSFFFIMPAGVKYKLNFAGTLFFAPFKEI